MEYREGKGGEKFTVKYREKTEDRVWNLVISPDGGVYKKRGSFS